MLTTNEHKYNLRAFTESLLHTLLAITLCVPSTFDGHVQGPEVMLQLEVNRPFSSRKVDLLDMFLPRNLLDFSNILCQNKSEQITRRGLFHSLDEQTDLRMPDQSRFDERAIRDCEFP